jgi:hypothetical protein
MMIPNQHFNLAKQGTAVAAFNLAAAKDQPEKAKRKGRRGRASLSFLKRAATAAHAEIVARNCGPQ